MGDKFETSITRDQSIALCPQVSQLSFNCPKRLVISSMKYVTGFGGEKQKYNHLQSIAK